MRLRSVSHQAKSDQVPEQKEMKRSQFAKRAVPLHQENSMLKDRLNQMKFEVEDNLQSVIDYLDEDFQEKAKLIDSQQLYSLIKEQIHKYREKIENQQLQIERLNFNISQIASQREEDVQNFQKKNEQMTEQIQKEKQLFKIEKAQLEDQIKALNCHNYEQGIILEQTKRDLKRELEINEQAQKQDSRQNELEKNIKSQKLHYDSIIQKLNHQIEVNNQVFKNELKIQEQRIEIKYQQEIEDNKLLAQQISELKQNYNQVKQQKDSIEKVLDQNNQKIKDIKSETINDKKTMSQNEKIIEELQKELIFNKNKVQIVEKREVKLKEQIEQNEDQIIELQQNNSNLMNQLKQLELKYQQQYKEIKARDQIAINNFNNQIQIQKIKYEKLLGKKVEESEQYQLIDFSQQYDDAVQIFYIQNLEKIKEEQEINIAELQIQIKMLETEHIQEIQRISEENENEKNLLIENHQQDMQKLQTEFEEQKHKIQTDCNYKLLLFSQQYSFQQDQQKQEYKQLQQIINQSKLNSDEKTKLLEVASEEIMQLRKKYDQDIFEQKSIQKQLKYDFDNEIFNIKQENSKKLDTLKRETDILQIKYKDLQNKDQIQKQKIAELLVEQKQDKSLINQLELQLTKKTSEISKQNETIKVLNTKINVLMLEVDNTKKTYNIFSSSPQHSSQRFLKKIDLEFSIDSNQQRPSSSEYRLKTETQGDQKKTSRNYSSYGPRQQYQIRILHQA